MSTMPLPKHSGQTQKHSPYCCHPEPARQKFNRALTLIRAMFTMPTFLHLFVAFAHVSFTAPAIPHGADASASSAPAAVAAPANAMRTAGTLGLGASLPAVDCGPWLLAAGLAPPATNRNIARWSTPRAGKTITKRSVTTPVAQNHRETTTRRINQPTWQKHVNDRRAHVLGLTLTHAITELYQ